VVGGKDDAEGRGNHVETRIRVREREAVALVEPDGKAFGARALAGLLELMTRNVESGDLGAEASGEQRDTTGSAGQIEQPLAGAGRERRDDALVDRCESCGESLVAGAAPESGDLGRAQSLSLASAVSSFRTSQSSG
jgi:hypothetical protein